jgi:hypothetical protein
MPAPVLITWDWKEQTPIEKVAAAIQFVCRDLPTYPRIYAVYTESDQYAVVVSLEEMTQEQIDETWKRRWAEYE